MFFADTIVRWYLKQRVPRLRQLMERPLELQERIFRYLIRSAAHTEWGKKYHYATIKTYQEFKNRVPVQDYETLKPYIERMMRGEKNILWCSDIRWFAKSSGTTNDRSKFIPVSHESLTTCHFKAGADVLASYMEQVPKTKIFRGKGLVMGGSQKVCTSTKNIRYGDVSAVMLYNLPFLARQLQTPSREIALLDDWEEKINSMVKHTMHENVTHLVGVPTWTLVLLKELLQQSGKKTIDEIWKNLELYIHGGVSFKPYRRQFEQLIPTAGMHYFETYNASEGFFGMQYSLQEDDLLLMTDHGIYYEFVPAEHAHDPNPTAKSLEEIEPGKNYAMLISTNGGLWRYNIGDTIIFTSKFPFRFIISGRTKHYINAFGEEVIVENTDKAITIASLKTGAIVKDYTVAPYYISTGDKGCHEWLIEFEIPPSNLEYFTAELDHALQEVNSDYEAKRFKDIALTAPRIHVAKENTFYSWLKSKGKLGGQNKVPRLSNDRSVLEEIMRFTTS